MARPINAALTVSAFTATGNPGEYTFDSAYFNNQADRTGNGSYDVQVGFALYVPSTDANTGTPLIGVVHRYRLTSVTQPDPSTLSGTMVWDELGVEETEVPTSGVGCLLCQTSPNHQLGFLPSDSIYPDLVPGSTAESMAVDSWNIIDNLSGGGGGGSAASFKSTFGDGAQSNFIIDHSLGTLDVLVQVFDLTDGSDVYCGVSRTSINSVTLSFTEAPISYRALIQAL